MQTRWLHLLLLATVLLQTLSLGLDPALFPTGSLPRSLFSGLFHVASFLPEVSAVAAPVFPPFSSCSDALLDLLHLFIHGFVPLKCLDFLVIVFPGVLCGWLCGLVVGVAILRRDHLHFPCFCPCGVVRRSVAILRLDHLHLFFVFLLEWRSSVILRRDVPVACLSSLSCTL